MVQWTRPGTGTYLNVTLNKVDTAVPSQSVGGKWRPAIFRPECPNGLDQEKGTSEFVEDHEPGADEQRRNQTL